MVQWHFICVHRQRPIASSAPRAPLKISEAFLQGGDSAYERTPQQEKTAASHFLKLGCARPIRQISAQLFRSNSSSCRRARLVACDSGVVAPRCPASLDKARIVGRLDVGRPQQQVHAVFHACASVVPLRRGCCAEGTTKRDGGSMPSANSSTMPRAVASGPSMPVGSGSSLIRRKT